MAITDRQNPSAEKKKSLFRLFPFWQSRTTISSSPPSSTQNQPGRNRNRNTDVSKPSSALSISSVARSILPARRRLRLDPSSYLYFPCTSPSIPFDWLFALVRDWSLGSLVRDGGLCVFADEPGKQVRSAIKLKNTSKSHTAFKVTETCSTLLIDSHVPENVDFLLTLFVPVPNNCTEELLHASSWWCFGPRRERLCYW